MRARSRLSFLGAIALFGAFAFTSGADAREVVFELEWGFGPTPSEIYWDAVLEIDGGRILSMEAVSFEADRHDRLSPPSFRSFTLNDGTDGMVLIVEGDKETTVRLRSKEGEFQWSVGQLEGTRRVKFPSRSKGALVVRMKEFLGDTPRLLSDGATQDSDPAACRLKNGRLVVVWRAFLGLPSETTWGGDQIRAAALDEDGKPGALFSILAAPGDVERLAVVPEGESGCLLVWAEQRERNWDLYAASLQIGDAIETAELERLTREPGVDRSPALAVAPDGSVILAHQGWRDGESAILSRVRSAGRWGEEVRLSAGAGNSWDPAIAVAKTGSPSGATAVAWSSWNGGSYDVHLRVREGETWGPALVVASSERFEAHPALAYDRTGGLWIAYEEGRAGWGMDSHSAGLRSQRNVRLRLYRNQRIEEPAGNASLKLPDVFDKRSEMACLARDGRGVLWLFFRSLSGSGPWTIFGSALGNEGWSPPAAARLSAGGQSAKMAAVTSAAGDLVAIWPSDHRTTRVAKDSHIYASSLPRRERRTVPVEGRKAAASSAARRPIQEAVRPETLWRQRQLGLYFGDLHRHTELSVCRTGADGSLEDAHRYAIDAAGLDFLCVTDHVQHVKILNDYDYWLTGKTADLHRVKGVHQPFYGYERSQRWPYGHRNIIGLDRHPKRVPRTADNRPWSANDGYPGEARVPPPELWRQLIGRNVITIPHTSANPVMGTDFGHRPAAIEPVVEIYQGCRISYEHASAPDPRRAPGTERFGGATRAGGFIWDALAKGYRYGFIASSDHVATHNSYACVWADSFANASILDALTKRRCYAATDRIVCDLRMGGNMMGAEFTAEEIPPLEIHVEGTAELERIDVIRDNRVVFTYRPQTPSRTARFSYRDLDVASGTHYYYSRVIQKDRNMAWMTPIWVELEGKS